VKVQLHHSGAVYLTKNACCEGLPHAHDCTDARVSVLKMLLMLIVEFKCKDADDAEHCQRSRERALCADILICKLSAAVSLDQVASVLHRLVAVCS